MDQGSRRGLVASLVAGGLLLTGCSAAADPDGAQVAPLVAQAPVDEQERVETVDLECSDATGEAVDTFAIERTESPDFSEVWASETNVLCAPSELVEAGTDVEQAAADELGRPAIHTLYAMCGASSPQAAYVRNPSTAITSDSARTFVAMLKLCPDFPYAAEFQAAIDGVS